MAALIRLCVALVLATPLACAPKPADTDKPEAGAKAAESAEGASRLPDDARIGRYVSSPWGFSTVSYWIEGEEGVVVIDTQFLPSAARELLRVAEDMTQKPVVAAIVLHPNPDKFNGAAVFQERGVPVLTSDQVIAAIPSVHAKRLAAFGERYRPDYPETAPTLESFGDASTTLELAGLPLQAIVLGPGCSDAHVAIAFDGHLFVGDLVATDGHAWLELGYIEEWRARLAQLQALAPKHVHPGRGPSAGAVALVDQDRYLALVAAIVDQERARLGEAPTRADLGAAIDRARARVVEAYPGLRFPVFLEIGIPAVFRRPRATQP